MEVLDYTGRFCRQTLLLLYILLCYQSAPCRLLIILPTFLSVPRDQSHQKRD